MAKTTKKAAPKVEAPKADDAKANTPDPASKASENDAGDDAPKKVKTVRMEKVDAEGNHQFYADIHPDEVQNALDSFYRHVK